MCERVLKHIFIFYPLAKKLLNYHHFDFTGMLIIVFLCQAYTKLQKEIQYTSQKYAISKQFSSLFYIA